MRIGGLQKSTLLDFPGKISAIVFTYGCNFCCPYCHNPELHSDKAELLSEKEILAFLNKRRGLLDGVVISGGEPTLQQDLTDFCLKLKDMEYALKLDTNGSNPEKLAQLCEMKLLDYAAMDLKTDPGNYPCTLCSKELNGKILQSMRVLAGSGIEHEFRCTCVPPFINRQTITAIAQTIKEISPENTPLFLQRARLEHVLHPEFFTEKILPSPQELEEFRETALKYISNCIIR